MRRDDPLSGKTIQECSQGGNRLRVQMCFGLFQQCEEVRLEAAISSKTILGKGVEDEHRGETAAAKAVLPEG